MRAWIAASIARAPGSWLMSGFVVVLFLLPIVLHFGFGVGR